MDTPDLIVKLFADGSFAGIISTLPLTYQTAKLCPGTTPESKAEWQLGNVAEQDFLGTHRELLLKLEIVQPSKEFDPKHMMELCIRNKFMRQAFEKYGQKPSHDIEMAYPAVVKILKALYNAFLPADERLMEAYLNLQK